MFIRSTIITGMIVAAVMVPAVVIAETPSSAGFAYGRGVQAYFAGRSDEAEQYLAQAIIAQPEDPRPYYFRALSLLRLGRADEARTDLSIGGEIEARHPGQFAVGKALERVQGSVRLTLEEYRRQARAAVTMQQIERRNSRYETNAGPSEEVERQRVSVPLEKLMEPGTLADWMRGSAAAAAPIDSAVPLDSHDRNVVESSEGVLADPFADDPQPSPPEAMADDPLPAESDMVEPEIADADAAEAQNEAGGKIRSERLFGILGRVLGSAVPVPSLEELRRHAPSLPGTGQSAESPNGDDEFGDEFGSESDATSPDDANPFGGP